MAAKSKPRKLPVRGRAKPVARKAKRRQPGARAAISGKTQDQVHAEWLEAERAFREVERQFYPVPGQGEPKPVTEEGRRQMEQLRKRADALREQYFASMPKR